MLRGQWNRARHGLVILAVLIAAAAAPASGQAGPPPNILFVIFDDFGVDVLAAYGEAGACSADQTQCFSDGDCPFPQTCDTDYPATPTIDGIAADGVLFRNVWAAQTCRPARAAGLSGRYGLRTGVTDNSGALDPTERTIPEAVSDLSIVPSAYATAAFGKWGLGDGASGPNDHGFDHYAGATGGSIGGDYFDWNRTVNGQTDPCFLGSAVCPTVAYSTSVNVNDAIDWIGGQTGPWFIWFAFNAPHSPFHIPPHDLVSPATLSRLPTDVGGQTLPEGTECSGADRRICYLAMIEAADAELDRLLAVVSASTVIVVLGDNGTPRQTTAPPFPSDHAKGTIYEGGINVPLIYRDPGLVSQGSESAALVHIVDLFATAVELAGGTVPVDRPLDSRSLLPLIADPSLPLRFTGYAETADAQAARDERYKLIRGTVSDEFYDLEGDPPGVPADPFEQNDLLPGGLDPGEQAAYDALSFEIESLLNPSGAVPDGRDVAGTPLTVSEAGGGQITLSWGASCSGSDSDYGVYEGTLGDFTSHSEVMCGTGGATTATFVPAPGGTYYLVVPSNGVREGSYGGSSGRTARGQGVSSCLPQSAPGCE